MLNKQSHHQQSPIWSQYKVPIKHHPQLASNSFDRLPITISLSRYSYSINVYYCLYFLFLFLFSFFLSISLSLLYIYININIYCYYLVLLCIASCPSSKQYCSATTNCARASILNRLYIRLITVDEQQRANINDDGLKYYFIYSRMKLCEDILWSYFYKLWYGFLLEAKLYFIWMSDFCSPSSSIRKVWCGKDGRVRRWWCWVYSCYILWLISLSNCHIIDIDRLNHTIIEFCVQTDAYPQPKSIGVCRTRSRLHQFSP